MATSSLPGPHQGLTALQVLGSAPALPLTDARECWPCGGSGYDHTDSLCHRCDGFGALCVSCYGHLDRAPLGSDPTRCDACEVGGGGE